MPFLKWLSPFLPNTIIGAESMQATTNNERIARKLALDFISNPLGINGANRSAGRHEPIGLIWLHAILSKQFRQSHTAVLSYYGDSYDPAQPPPLTSSTN